MSRKIYKFKTQINSVMLLEKKGGGYFLLVSCVDQSCE